jgi:hypothetical protein
MDIWKKQEKVIMILKNNALFYGALFLCLPSLISANISTLQHWDPIPVFNAANLNMPADTPFCYGVKQRLLDENASKAHRWGINVSPFVQKAIRAQKTDDIYFGVHGASTVTPGMEMSDFQGTPYLMGLFLGKDENGLSIWGGPAAVDTGIVTDITITNVQNINYQLPVNLQNAVIALNDLPNSTTAVNTANNAIIYNLPINPSTNTAPSIFSESVLEQDDTYFGAFSVPLTYQKAGFRWELNFDISNSIGFLARGGFCQITQKAGAARTISSNAENPQKNGDPSLYAGLNTVANASTGSGGPIPESLATSTFNEWISNNINQLLDPINGVDYDISTFSETGIEDIQLLAFIRHPFAMHPSDPDKYTSMVLTPYAIIGWTIPLAPSREYFKLFSLPFGNNSHTAVGGVVGLTFDFIDSIEFGFEFGATGFLKKTIDHVPCPNHPLQRVIYPYQRDLYVSPGFNGQFAFIFNAYEFAPNTSFSFRYNYVQHNQDTITQVTPNPYFFPNMLEDQSMWTSQMFVAALTFEIQPSIFASLAWQGSFAQKNAYCSNTILGSLNFQF